MDDKDHDHQDGPTAEGTQTTAEGLLVKKETNGDGADNLGYPINEVIERPSTDIKHSAIVVIELYMNTQLFFQARDGGEHGNLRHV